MRVTLETTDRGRGRHRPRSPSQLRGQEDYDAGLVIQPAETSGPGARRPGAARRAPRGSACGLEPARWGRRPLGMLAITLTDRYRLSRGQGAGPAARSSTAARSGAARQQRRPQPPAEPGSASIRRRAAGEGGEFAGVREFVPGDRQRRINWPATTRHGTPAPHHLRGRANAEPRRHRRRDDPTSASPARARSTWCCAARRAPCARYLAARDRVGLIIYAGRLSWIGPGQGQRHFHRLLDLMMSGPGGWERADGLTRLPRAALPPGALIMVFSPLLDPRLIEALRDLRERGFSVLVVDVLNTEPPHDASRAVPAGGPHVATRAAGGPLLPDPDRRARSCTGTGSAAWTSRWRRTPAASLVVRR